MAATELTGNALWATFGATVLTADFHSFDESQSSNLVDATAGSDADRTYIALQKDGQISFTTLILAAGSGTVIYDAVAPGTEATLIWAPRGSTATYEKFSVNAIVADRAVTWPFDNVGELSVTFQRSGAQTAGTI